MACFNLTVVVVDSAPNIAEVNSPFLPEEETVVMLAPRERTEENENFQRQRPSAYSVPSESTEEQNFKRQQSTNEVFSRNYPQSVAVVLLL